MNSAAIHTNTTTIASVVTAPGKLKPSLGGLASLSTSLKLMRQKSIGSRMIGQVMQ